MTNEVVTYLRCRPGGFYVDCTLGGGGHSLEILKASSPDGKLLGIDKDTDAIKESRKTLNAYSPRVTFIHGDFKQLNRLAAERHIEEVDGILIDLGISSHQLDSAERGFSFLKEGPLDMRMNRESGLTASDLLCRLSVKELESVFRDYGEERWARRIAQAVKLAGEIETTLDLAKLVENAVPKRFHPKRIHVATKVFQALRIAVNEELLSLDKFIESAANLLREGGRMVVISFHSLEDRLVKNGFRDLSLRCVCPPDLPYCSCGRENIVRVITKKPITPSPYETGMNPRARSAKMRVAERL